MGIGMMMTWQASERIFSGLPSQSFSEEWGEREKYS